MINNCGESISASRYEFRVLQTHAQEESPSHLKLVNIVECHKTQDTIYLQRMIGCNGIWKVALLRFRSNPIQSCKT